MSMQASASLPPLDVSYEDDLRVLEQAPTEDYTNVSPTVRSSTQSTISVSETRGLAALRLGQAARHEQARAQR
jgi:hypothetical protein